MSKALKYRARGFARSDKERVELVAFETFRAELAGAFAEPDSVYVSLAVDELIGRNPAYPSE